MKELCLSALLEEGRTLAWEHIKKYSEPWRVLESIEKIIWELGACLGEEFEEIDKGVWVARDAKVAKSATVLPPAIIDKGAEVRHCAYIRGKAIIGKGAVVGNSTEIKNSILFDGVQVPHYNYVGDSILGYRAHLGAGVICSNVRGDKRSVKIKINGEKIDTGLGKMGAVVGDFAEIGCGTVLNPGTVVGRGAQICPLCSVVGYVPTESIYKAGGRLGKRV